MQKHHLIFGGVVLLLVLNITWLIVFHSSQNQAYQTVSKTETTPDVSVYVPRLSEPVTEAYEKTFYVEQQEYELGYSVEGDTIEGEAKINNNSGNDYSILNVLTSCGCTTAKIDSPTVPAGQSLILPFSIRTDGESGLFVARFQVNYKNEHIHIFPETAATGCGD